jgi:cytochrome b
VAAIEHLKELAGADRPRDVGHNPLGGAMVVALLLGLLLQVVAGLFSADTDTGLVTGPLANLVPDKWIERATSFHTFWINILLLMVAIHVLAALTYLVWKRQNLIGAMFTGRKRLDDVVAPGKPAPTLSFASGRLAFSLLIVAADIVYFIVRLGG